MSIQRIAKSELPSFIQLLSLAYNIKTQEDVDKEMKQWAKFLDAGVELYGYYMKDTMAGCMALYPFEMNYMDHYLPVSGIGAVAVHPVYKREKVCLNMIQYALKAAKEEGCYFSVLYPFRPDFYRSMGYGLGPITYKYSFRLDQFQDVLADVQDGEGFIRQFQKEDFPNILEFYRKIYITTHGYIMRPSYELLSFLERPNVKVFAYIENTSIQGLAVYVAKPIHPENFLENKIVVYEWNACHLKAKKALFDFFYKQRDQFTHIEFVSQDASIPFIIKDPRHASHNLLIPTIHHHVSNAGYGMMYQALRLDDLFTLFPTQNIARYWEGKTFSIVVKDPFTLQDQIYTFLIQSDQLQFVSDERSDVVLQGSITTLSSLCMGSLSFSFAHQNGLVNVSDIHWISFFTTLFNIPVPQYDSHF
ncbi:MAG: GNAT family N-acetyltransferase [Caldisericia bacterium]|nr:GNAT family N-acetyltransferase [Caldisericia bacterium]MDD4614303.1 GNAT family N-acetyltransferase [Caldisericia bacterium]